MESGEGDVTVIQDYIRILRASNWLKKNVPFLYSWHAYVGYELDLFEAFKKPKTVKQVAVNAGIQEELLQEWVQVGLSLKHLKKKRKNLIKTTAIWRLPSSKKKSLSSGIILKEMMELHIPALLSYPELLRSEEKQIFDSEEHGPTVAKTSKLLERFALPKVKRIIKKKKIKTVLDIGCGEAGYLVKLAEEDEGLEMVGVEMNKEVAEEASRITETYDNIEIKQADIRNYQPREPFDLMMANNVLHYIDPNERQDFFNMVAGWMDREGTFLMITPMKDSRHGRKFSSAFNSFFNAFDNLYPIPTKKEIKTLCSRTGLKLKKLNPIVKKGGWYVITLEK